MIWIGTSGWQYDSWKGRFYPKGLPQRAWLEYFAARFHTVEVNNSFYRLPSGSTFGAWRDRTPEDFLFAVKASRYVTHIRRLRDAGDSVELFMSRARLLKDKLGPVLYQLPPNLPADLDRLAAFLEVVPADVPAAFEFRHPSWDDDRVRRLLEAKGCTVVLADRPGTRFAGHVTGGWSFIRFHQGTRVGPWYTRSKLRTWANRILSLPASDVYAYFNNDPEGAAIKDARTLTELLIDRGLEVRGAGEPA